MTFYIYTFEFDLYYSTVTCNHDSKIIMALLPGWEDDIHFLMAVDQFNDGQAWASDMQFILNRAVITLLQKISNTQLAAPHYLISMSKLIIMLKKRYFW